MTLNMHDQKYWKKLKEHLNWLKINITYEKIVDATMKWCVYNWTKKSISNVIFSVSLNNDNLKDKGFIIWGLFGILKIDKTYKNKSKEWVQFFVQKNKNLINKIVAFCNN